MQIQANLGSTIAMAFDECVEEPRASTIIQSQLRAHHPLAQAL